MVVLHMPTREELIAVVDIDFGSVQVAVVALPHAGPVRVTASAHTLISLEKETVEHAISTIGDSINDACTRALETLKAKNEHGTINQVFATIHAPWTHSEYVRKRTDFPEETRVRESHIKDAAKETLAEAHGVNSSSILEAAVVRTWLNGYEVREAEGKSSHSLAIAAIVSDVEPQVKRNAESALQKVFPVAKIEWRSAARGIVQVLSHIGDDENYVAVDMGMNATHIISTRGGMVRSDTVVSEGIRTILSKLDPARSAEETLGYVRMLGRDACEGAACEAIQKAIATIEPDLAKTFGTALGALAAERRLSNRLILNTHPDMVDWMERFFSRIDFAQFTTTTLPFTVTPFSDVIAAAFVHVDGQSIPSSLLLESSLVNIEKHG